MLKYQPLNQLVQIKLDPEEEKKGSIILPHQVMQHIGTGIVISIADDIPETYEQIDVGDRVVFKHYVGQSIEILGEETIILIPRDEIVGKFIQPEES